MTDEDRRLLDMAGQRWNHSGAMADATVNRLRRLRVAAR